MRLFIGKLVLCFLCFSLVFCCSCAVTRQPERSRVVVDPNIVAKIDDYVITRNALETKLKGKLRPADPEEFQAGRVYKLVDPNIELIRMVAEKAMIMEARKQNYLQHGDLKLPLKQFRETLLVNLLLKTYLEGKVTVTDAEIDEKIKSEPRLNRGSAKMMLERSKSNKLVEQFYSSLCKKLNVRKVKDNFPRVAQIYGRLLKNSRSYGAVFVRVKQIKEELSPEEKNLPLVAFDKGKITLEDWLYAVDELSPPRRPADLNTPEGIERFLEDLRTPIFVAEAKRRKLDRDQDIVKQMKNYEDMWLRSEVIKEKVKDIQVAPEEIAEYYERHEKEFGVPDMLTIDQIWCKDLKAAQEAKAELANGAGFESIKQGYSLDKGGAPVDVYPAGEGVFFKYLWMGEPNRIGGPLQGFYNDQIKWRVVKILKKKPGQPKKYSADIEAGVKGRIWDEKAEATLDKYGKELLMKYPYQVYPENIKTPLDIP